MVTNVHFTCLDLQVKMGKFLLQWNKTFQFRLEENIYDTIGSHNLLPFSITF